MYKAISLNTKELLESGIVGVCWVIFGFIQIFKFNDTIIIASEFVLVIASIFAFIPYLIKTEVEDEMAKRNENRARAATYIYLNLFITICMLISILKDGWTVNLKLIIPFLIGGIYIVKYIFFAYYEKVGD